MAETAIEVLGCIRLAEKLILPQETLPQQQEQHIEEFSTVAEQENQSALPSDGDSLAPENKTKDMKGQEQYAENPLHTALSGALTMLNNMSAVYSERFKNIVKK